MFTGWPGIEHLIGKARVTALLLLLRLALLHMCKELGIGVPVQDLLDDPGPAARKHRRCPGGSGVNRVSVQVHWRLGSVLPWWPQVRICPWRPNSQGASVWRGQGLRRWRRTGYRLGGSPLEEQLVVAQKLLAHLLLLLGLLVQEERAVCHGGGAGAASESGVSVQLLAQGVVLPCQVGVEGDGWTGLTDSSWRVDEIRLAVNHSGGTWDHVRIYPMAGSLVGLIGHLHPGVIFILTSCTTIIVIAIWRRITGAWKATKVFIFQLSLGSRWANNRRIIHVLLVMIFHWTYLRSCSSLPLLHRCC